MCEREELNLTFRHLQERDCSLIQDEIKETVYLRGTYLEVEGGKTYTNCFF